MGETGERRNLVLIGFPGVGKSSVGRAAAERLSLPFVDTDELIERREGRPITRIFRASGEPYFRELERQVIAEVAASGGVVISTGGGCVQDPRNIAALERNGVIVYLTATPEAIFERLQHQTNRPLLLFKTRWELAEKIRSLMKRRAFDYIQTTNVIDVTCPSREEVVSRVVAIYRGELRIRLFGLVGENLERTLSPLMHNAAFNHQGLHCHYHCFETGDLPAVVARMRRLGISGINVTFPYKEAILPLLDELSPEVQAIGAANTVTNRGGRLVGTNTDAPGALAYLKRVLHRRRPDTELAGLRAVIFGYGGAARAVAYALRNVGCRVTLCGRNGAKAARTAENLGVDWARPDALDWGRVELLVNATPLGMGELADRTPVPAERLHPGMIVYDLVYHPLETRLLREARERSCLTVDGLGMLVHQGAMSYSQWLGRRAPRYLMERVTRRYLRQLARGGKRESNHGAR